MIQGAGELPYNSSQGVAVRKIVKTQDARREGQL